MKHTNLLYTLALLATFALSACSDDSASELVPDTPGKEDVAKEKVNVTVNLSARSLNSVMTRAGEPEINILDPSNEELNLIGTSNEHINDWFMILVHAGDHLDAGKIATIVKRSDSQVIEGDATAPVLREQFRLSLSPGKYHVFTFGNINYDTFRLALSKHVYPNATSHTHYPLDQGDVMPDIKDFAWEEFHNQVISESVHIPLSSVDSDLEVDDVAASMEIELERIMGKIQFYFSNRTSSDWIRIKRFEMIPLRNKTYLLEHAKEGGLVATPDHVHNDNAETMVRCNDATRDLMQVNWNGFVVNKYSSSHDVFVKCPDLGFYVNESVPELSDAYPLGHFKLRLEIERVINNNGTDVVSAPEVRSSMLHNLTAIERNQWYMQPIMFTDWVLQPEIHYYPPIGGYPVVQIQENSKFEECYSTFEGVTSDSPFQIRLRLHDSAQAPDLWYDINDQSKVNGKVTIAGVEREQPYYIRVTDPSGIFNHNTLSLNNSGLITSPDGQLTGHFTGNTGRAIISVYANIQIDPNDPDLHYTYERDLYVIVK